MGCAAAASELDRKACRVGRKGGAAPRQAGMNRPLAAFTAQATPPGRLSTVLTRRFLCPRHDSNVRPRDYQTVWPDDADCCLIFLRDKSIGDFATPVATGQFRPIPGHSR
jgi:hypothetical protein